MVGRKRIPKFATSLITFVPGMLLILASISLLFARIGGDQLDLIAVVLGFSGVWLGLLFLTIFYFGWTESLSKELNGEITFSRFKIAFFTFLPVEFLSLFYLSDGRTLANFAEVLIKHPLLAMPLTLLSFVAFFLLLIRVGELAHVLKSRQVVSNHPSFFIAGQLVSVLLTFGLSLILPIYLFVKAKKAGFKY